MKAILILLTITFALLACDKTDDETRAEKAAKARAEKNMADHEKRK